MTILYEIQTLDRFPRTQDFLSYSRLVKGDRSSAGKPKAGGGGKMGNIHLKWAFSEATALFLRDNPEGKTLASAGAQVREGQSHGQLARLISSSIATTSAFSAPNMTAQSPLANWTPQAADDGRRNDHRRSVRPWRGGGQRA